MNYFTIFEIQIFENFWYYVRHFQKVLNTSQVSKFENGKKIELFLQIDFEKNEGIEIFVLQILKF